MRVLSYAYRFLSNFVFLTLAYFSLNAMERYQQRAVLAILVLLYAAMRAATAMRSFYSFQRIERLELEARHLRHGRGRSGRIRRPQADRHRGRHVSS
jgi:hypothetical protein